MSHLTQWEKVEKCLRAHFDIRLEDGRNQIGKLGRHPGKEKLGHRWEQACYMQKKAKSPS